jgi:hypothetical protein
MAFWSGTEEAYATAPLFSELSLGGVPSSAGGGEPGEFVAPPPMPDLPPQEFIPPPQEGEPMLPPPMPPPPMSPPPPFPTGTYLPGGAPLSGALLSLVPEQLTVSLQELVTVTVRVDSVAGLSDALFSIAYDPNVLEFRQAIEGDFLRRDDWPTAFSAVASPEPGRVELRMARLSDVDGGSGSGVLCTLVFLGKRAGASPVTVADGHFSGPEQAVVSVSSRRGVVVVR